MEDRHVATTFTWDGGDRRLTVYGVFDGHNGSSVAEHCRVHLPHHVASVLRTKTTDLASVPGCLRAAFDIVDEHAAAESSLRSDEVGSTACVAIVTRTSVWVANAGDSRAFIRTGDGTIVNMSADHKPSEASEHARIYRGGGVVTYGDGVARVQGRLSLSRSIGDRALRPHVVCTPDVRVWRRSAGSGSSSYMIIASDGVWDVMSNADVARIVDAAVPNGASRAYVDMSGVTQALKKVVAEARRLRSGDNITVMYVAL